VVVGLFGVSRRIEHTFAYYVDNPAWMASLSTGGGPSQKLSEAVRMVLVSQEREDTSDGNR